MNDNRLFTRAEAAQHLSITDRTLDRHIAAGKLKPVYVGHAKRFRSSDVDALVSAIAPPISPNLRPQFGNAQPVGGMSSDARELPPGFTAEPSRRAVA
jgi:excisionase family DNA binding protein